MALQVSVGFKTAILGPQAFDDVFAGGAIRIYTGPQPDTADEAARGTLLGTVTLGGVKWVPGQAAGGLRFLRNGPFISNYPQDNWLLVPVSSGVAGWWRLLANDDDGEDISYDAPRIDGGIKQDDTTAEMSLENTTLAVGEAVRIQSFFYTIPPIVGL